MLHPNYDFKQPRPINIKTTIFNMIEKDQTDDLIEFIKENKQEVQQFTAQNHWTVAMYAVRYGNKKLARFLHEQQMLYEHPQSTYSIIHAACFNNDVEILRILIDEFGKDPNQYMQYQMDNSPLKYAYKNDLLKTIEVLCSRGAYYQYENLTNGLIKETQLASSNNLQRVNSQQSLSALDFRYKSIRDKSEVQPSQVLIIKGNKPSDGKDKTTPFIRYMRFRNILFIKYIFNKCQNDALQLTPELEKISYIFENEQLFEQLVEISAPSTGRN